MKQAMKQNPQPKVIQNNEDKLYKEKMIMKILKYQNSKRFGDSLRKELSIKYTRDKLLKCSNDNLETILFRIRQYLNSKNTDNVIEHLATFGVKTYEQFVSQFYDINGFSDLILSNENFFCALERYAIESEVRDIPPSMSLLYTILSTTYIAHLQNQLKQARSNTKPTQKKEKVKDKKSDTKDENKEIRQPSKLKMGVAI